MRRVLRALVALALVLSAAGAGQPARHVVDGVDLGEATFQGDHGPIHLHKGHYDKGDWPSVDLTSVVSGRVSGTTVAIATIRYSPPATGFSETAEAFAIAGGKARWLATVGSYSYFNDTGPYVDPWFFTRFTANSVIVDRWDAANQCRRNRNWLVTTYALRGAKLVTVYARHHRRAGTPAYDGNCGTPAPTTRANDAQFQWYLRYLGAIHPATYAITFNGKPVLPNAHVALQAGHTYIRLSDVPTATGGLARVERDSKWIVVRDQGVDRNFAVEGMGPLTYRGTQYVGLAVVVGNIPGASLTVDIHARTASIVADAHAGR